jgi:hypothetical protein
MLSALLLDVDGTLAETERPGHLVAFNRAFSACGVPWRWDGARYGELLDVPGGRERLLHDMDSQPAAPSHPTERRVLAQMLHEAKCEFFAQVARSAGMQLRGGVHELLLDAMSAPAAGYCLDIEPAQRRCGAVVAAGLSVAPVVRGGGVRRGCRAAKAPSRAVQVGGRGLAPESLGGARHRRLAPRCRGRARSRHPCGGDACPSTASTAGAAPPSLIRHGSAWHNCEPGTAWRCPSTDSMRDAKDRAPAFSPYHRLRLYSTCMRRFSPTGIACFRNCAYRSASQTPPGLLSSTLRVTLS